MEKVVGKIDSHCVGKWEREDETCNGTPDAENEKDRKPCKWMRRCQAFTRHLKATEKKPDEYLEYKEEGDEIFVIPKDGIVKFKQFCDAMILRSKKRKKTRREKKRPGDFDARKLGPAEVTKKAAAKALSTRARTRRRELMGFLNSFKRVLIEKLDGRAFSQPGRIIRPGQFFLVSRLDTSNYISVHCKTAKGRDKALVSFKMKTMSLTWDIKFTMTPEELEKNCSKAANKRFCAESFDDGGRYKSVMKAFDEQKMILLAEEIAKLIASGKIDLPAV